MSNFNHIATKSSILTIAIQNLFGWASWRSLPTPKEILEARNAIAEAEAMFPNEPWVTEDLIGLLERLRAAVTAFEEAFQAQSEGRIPEVDNSVLPAGLDYAWLQETAMHLRISSSRTKTEWRFRKIVEAEVALVSQRLPETDIPSSSMPSALTGFTTVKNEKKWLLKVQGEASGYWGIVYKCQIVDGSGNPSYARCIQRTSSQAPANLDDASRMKRMEIRMTRERDIWLWLEHQNIAPLLGFSENPRPGLVSPWYCNGTLEQFLTSYPNSDRLELAIGCARELSYLHANDVIHGDVHEPNIMVDDSGNPRIIDFGGTTEVEPVPIKPTHSKVPTELRYLAIERAGHRDKNRASLESDVYSFGSVILFIMTGHHPFRNYETQREIDRFLEQNPESAVPGNPSEYKELPPTSPLWSLMFQCWELNVSHRPAMAVVHRRLEEMKSYNHGQADVTRTTENQGINAARVALNLLATANPMDRSLGFPMGLVRPSTSLAPVLSTGIHTGAFS